MGHRRAPAVAGYPDTVRGGGVHGQRLRPHAPSGLRRVARHARRRRPHHPRVRAVSNAAGRRHYWSAGSGTSRLAVNQLQQQGTIDEATVDRFLAGREVPIVEGRHCTFLFRGEADEVYLAQRILGLPSRLPMRRVAETTLWYVVLRVPQTIADQLPDRSPTRGACRAFQRSAESKAFAQPLWGNFGVLCVRLHNAGVDFSGPGRTFG